MERYKVKCFVEECNDDIAKSVKYEDTERFETFNSRNEAEEYIIKQQTEIMQKNLSAVEIHKYGLYSIRVQHNDDYSEIYTWKIERMLNHVSIVNKLKYYIIDNNGKLSDDELEVQLDKLICATTTDDGGQ